MATSDNFGLHLLDPGDTSRALIQVMQELMGTGATSNMNIIDKALANNFKIIEAADEPIGLKVGDEWDKLL